MAGLYKRGKVSRDFRAVQKEHGLSWSCLDVRHTLGSQLAIKGESLYKISALMRNSPQICRRHYAALITEDLAPNVEFATNPPPDTVVTIATLAPAQLPRMPTTVVDKLLE